MTTLGAADTALEYEVVIGLEVHAQLLTRSKMFCACSAAYQDAPPNTLVCPVCMGMPGVLPVINRRAVECVIKTGLALDCRIARLTKFDRKNYPYPDLMKGYQISQYDQPIAYEGGLVIDVDGREKRIGITRVHLEEDVAKLLHRTDERGRPYSLLDINRSGVPLMEIVSEPDIRSPEEAREYLIALRSILRYIGVSTANMEEGSFRCDANISVRPRGARELGPKVEVKNMNSFRAVYRALQYEARRQVQALREGETIVQETRGWVEERGVTVPQRTKEFASDYRYFPEPDLPPLVIEPAWVEEIRRSLPELPRARRARFMEQYGLPPYEAGLLTASREMADLFEEVMAAGPAKGMDHHETAKAVANWFLGELSRLMNATGLEPEEVRFAPSHLIELVGLVKDGTLSSTTAKAVFEEMFKTGDPPAKIVKEKGMAQVSDEDQLRAIVEQVVENNPRPVADYLGGKETAIRYLVGQVMKATRGRANPQMASRLLKERLDSLKGGEA